MPFLNPKLGIDFTDYIPDRTTNFTGREWVFEAIQNWLADPKGDRFFLLTGEPGSGKTAIAGRLSQFAESSEPLHPKLQPGYLNAIHFCSAARSTWVDPSNFCKSIALQLAQIQEYAIALANVDTKQNIIQVTQTFGTVINSSASGVVIENLDISGVLSAQEAFNLIVLNPLQMIYKDGFEKSITILVDSLDEALNHKGQLTIVDLLSKLKDLPPQVRFLLTTRPQSEILQRFEDAGHECSLSLGEGLTDSYKDVRKYVLNSLKQQPEELVSKLDPELSQDAFVTTVEQKSDGNFLYVSYLLQRLAEEATITQTSLNVLPKGLDGIYREFLGRLVEDKRTWRQEYAPVLGTLAVAQAALSREQLAAFVEMRKTEVGDILEALRQFLDADESLPISQRTYTLYHRSLADFLLNEDRAEGYWCEEQEQHERIIDYYEKESKSWQQLSQIDQYGLRHLVKHLSTSGRWNELYGLLTNSPDWMKAKFINCTGDAAYMADLELAISSFTETVEPDLVLTLVKLHTARQAIHQRVDRFDDTSLKVLVWLGREAEALSYTRLRAEAEEKFNGLLSVVSVLSEKKQIQPDLLDEVREAVEQIKDNDQRVEALRNLAVVLTQIGKQEDAQKVFGEAKAITRAIKSDRRRSEQLSRLAAALAGTGQSLEANETFKEAQAIASQIEDTERRVRALSQLAAALAEAGQSLEAKEAFKEARSMIIQIDNEGKKTKALSQLFATLAQAGNFQEALAVADEIEDESQQAEALGQIGIALAQAGNFTEARTVIGSVVRTQVRDRVLSQLVAGLAYEGQLDDAKAVARQIEDEDEYAKALNLMALALAQIGQQSEADENLTEAGKIARSPKEKSEYAKTLQQLANILSQVGQSKVAQEITNTSEYAETLRQLAETNQSIEEDIETQPSFSKVENESQQKPSSLHDFLVLTATVNAFEILIQAGKQTLADEVRAYISEFIEDANAGSFIEDESERREFLTQLANFLGQVRQFETDVEPNELLNNIRNSPFAGLDIRNNPLAGLALFEITSKLIQSRKFAEARELANLIGENSIQSEALCTLAAALVQAERREEAEAVFTEAHAATKEISNEYYERQNIALSQLAVALAQARYFVRAQAVAEEIINSSFKNKTLTELASFMIQAEQFREAKAVTLIITDYEARLRILRQLASSFAQTINLKEALNTLGLIGVNNFVSVLIEWISPFEKVQPGLFVKIIKEAVRIAGWVHPYWSQLYPLISEMETDA